MLYFLLGIIAIGVLLASENGKVLLSALLIVGTIGALLYFGFLILFFAAFTYEAWLPWAIFIFVALIGAYLSLHLLDFLKKNKNIQYIIYGIIFGTCVALFSIGLIIHNEAVLIIMPVVLSLLCIAIAWYSAYRLYKRLFVHFSKHPKTTPNINE